MPEEPENPENPQEQMPPPWENPEADDDGLNAQYLWVEARLDHPDNKQLKDRLLNFMTDAFGHPSDRIDIGEAMRSGALRASIQMDALQAAKRGERKRLADLIWNFEREETLGRRYEPSPLIDEVREYLARYLKNPSAFSTGRGRKAKPDHVGRDLTMLRVELIREVLKQGYPEQTPKQIFERAVDLVHLSFSKGSRVTRDTIVNYFLKNKRKT